MATISNAILSSTLQHIAKDAADALAVKYRFFEWATSGKGIKQDLSGREIVCPVIVDEHSAITYHGGSGFETTDEGVKNILQNAAYQWSFMTAPVALDAKTAAINSGSAKIIDLYSVHTQNVIATFGRRLNEQVLNGQVAGSDVNTLYGGTAGAGTGFLEGVVPASQSNVVGGLSKATYNIPGWTNAFATAGGAFNTASAGRIAMDSIQTQLNSRTRGDRPFEIVLASEASFALYKASLAAQERYVDVKTLDGGNMALMYGGAPIYPDLAMNNTFSRAGANIFSMYFLSSAGLSFDMLPAANFKLVERGIAVGSAVSTWQIQVGCQLTSGHLGSLGVLVNADA